jgi:SPP1 gp7 family putative phage head morphogenesis protein
MAVVTPSPSQNFNSLEELGRSGFAHWYGNIEERFIKELYGSDGIAVFDEMRRRDPTLRAILFATKLMARTAEWRAVSPTDKPGPEMEATEHLQSCIEDMSHTMSDAVDFQLTMLPFGWSWQEICYKRRDGRDAKHPSQFDDGRIGWRKWAPRKQKSWYKWGLDDTGGVEGLWQAPPDAKGGTQLFIPITKSLHFTTENDGGDPEGISIFESCYEHWYFLKNLLPTLGIGFERSFVGLPVFTPEEKLDDTDKSALAAVGKGLRVGEKAYATIPKGIGFELVSTENQVAAPLLDTIKYFRVLMLQAALADFINLGAGDTGSWALGRDKSELFIMAVNGWLDKIEAVLNRFAVPRLFAYNEYPGLETYPQLQHTVIEKPDLQELGQFLTQIASLIHMSDEDEIWIRGRSGMPEMVAQGEGEGNTEKPPVDEGDEPPEGQLAQSPSGLAEFQEPPDRPDEGELILRLQRVMDDRREKLSARMVTRQADPGDRWWDEEQQAWVQALLPGFEEIAEAGAEVAAAQVSALGIGVDWTLVNTAVTDWARTYTFDLVKDLTATSRKALGKQIAAWIESGEPLPDLIGRLERIYGPERAELIATTEVTRAYAEGNKIAWAESGVVEGFQWQTANDELVCPICGPLNGQVVKAGGSFPGGLEGPPAHPRCRCWISPIVIGESP